MAERDFKREAFRQIKAKTPERVRVTRKEKGEEQARRQFVAIALDLARELERNNS